MAVKKAKARKAKDANVGKTFFIPENALDCSSVNTSAKALGEYIDDSGDLYDGEVAVGYEVTVVRRLEVTKSAITVTPV